jgi:mannose-6-phosphate isomerase-like protein (cupin superfamily)
VPDVFTIFDGSSYEVLERPSGPGDPLVMRFRLIHKCGTPPPHVHPGAVETFEIEQGSFEMLVGDEWRAASAGETVVVPAGLRHTFRNESGAEVVIRNTHAPHHDFEAYIKALAELTQELEITSVSSPGAAVKMAMLWQRHTDLIQPADLPLKIAFPALAAAGRLLRLSVPG